MFQSSFLSLKKPWATLDIHSRRAATLHSLGCTLPKPVVTHLKLGGTHPKPVGTHLKLVGTHLKLGGTLPKPVATLHKPVATLHKPGGTHPKLGASHPRGQADTLLCHQQVREHTWFQIEFNLMMVWAGGGGGGLNIVLFWGGKTIENEDVGAMMLDRGMFPIWGREPRSRDLGFGSVIVEENLEATFRDWRTVDSFCVQGWLSLTCQVVGVVGVTHRVNNQDSHAEGKGKKT